MKAIIKRKLPDAPAPTKAVRIDDWRRTLINALDAQQAAEKQSDDKSIERLNKDT